MIVIKTVDECFSYRNKCNGSIGFVPTMGALHAGHRELIKQSLKTCDITIVSIFINPKQFGTNEDLENYPKNLKDDLDLLSNLKVDCVFTPQQTEMYSENHSINLSEHQLSKVLEGNSRPQFFNGVITVVAKLFNICNPTDVFFGEKDAQQLIIIRKLIKDMNYNIVCHAIPTVRSKNGLALSSRNQHLNDDEHNVASNIYKSLCVIKRQLDGGEKQVNILKSSFRVLIEQCNDLEIDYFSIADFETLEEIQDKINKTILISTAVFIKNIRLIDNIKYTI